METIVGLVVSFVALMCSIFSLFRSLHQPRELKELRQGFKKLELDAEDMWERVRSHLGRVSRLKGTGAFLAPVGLAPGAATALGASGEGLAAEGASPSLEQIRALAGTQHGDKTDALPSAPRNFDPDLLYATWLRRTRG